MKLTEGTYSCPWCQTIFKQEIRKTSVQGKKGIAVDQCVCPNCNRYVSQKTKNMMEKKE